MPAINICKETRSEILTFFKLDSNLFGYVTRNHGARVKQSSNCESIIRYKDENLGFNTTAICFSRDSKLLAFATKAYIYIADMIENRIINTIFIGEENLTILVFDPTSKYLIAGNDDGRTLLYKYNSTTQQARLCSFPHNRTSKKIENNFVSSIVFYENLLAVSGYGGAIFIIDTNTSAKTDTIIHKKTTKNALCFLDEKTIISGDEDGELSFISLDDNSVIKTISLSQPIKHIVAIEDSKYLLIHTGDNTIAVVDYVEFKVIDKDYVKLADDEKIISCDVMDNMLFISFKNKVISLQLRDTDKLKSLLLDDNIVEAYALVEAEVMLKDTPEYETLEKAYGVAYKNATNALMQSNKKLALQIINIYAPIPSKKELVDTLFKSREYFEKYSVLYKEKKYALAYSMSEKFPILQNTRQYLIMEESWEKLFKEAQRQIVAGDFQSARRLFQEYQTIASKKPLIELVLKHNEELVQFLAAYYKKDFQKVSNISSKNELFKKTPICKILTSDIEKMLDLVEHLIKRNKVVLAIKNLLKIEDIPQYTEKVTKLYKMCDEMTKLQTAYKADDFLACYALVDKHTHLGFSPVGKLLQKNYAKLIQKCEEFSALGDVKGIKITLGNLITLQSRRDKVGNLLRGAFREHIKTLLVKKDFNASANMIYSYVDIFTKDSEIVEIMNEHESISKTKLAITQQNNEDTSRYSWMNSKYIIEL